MSDPQPKYLKLDAAGRLIDDDDPIVRDGQSIRVPLRLMDGKSHVVPPAVTDRGRSPAGTLHQPGQVTISDAIERVRQTLFGARDRRLRDAWKDAPTSPETAVAPPSKPVSTPAPAQDRESAYADRCRRLQNAWKEGK